MGVFLTARILGIAAKTVFQDTGYGSWFGHGRFLGIHNPDDSNHGKAIDPYINLLTLARISRTDGCVRRKVYHNLAGRLGEMLPPAVLELFSTGVMIRALRQAPEIHEGNRPFIREFMKNLTGHDLFEMVSDGTPHTDWIKSEILNHPKLPRGAKIELAGFSYMPAFEALKGSLTEKELIELTICSISGKRCEILAAVARHPNATSKTFEYSIKDNFSSYGRRLIAEFVIPNLAPAVRSEVEELMKAAEPKSIFHI